MILHIIIASIQFHKYSEFDIHRRTFRTRIVAGELTTDSLRFGPATGGSSRGLLDADVAIANAAAAVDVLLLFDMNFMTQTEEERERDRERKRDDVISVHRSNQTE